MNRTRWKLMIGALGLSLGGVAVLAGDPSSAGAVSCAPTPTHTAQRAATPPVALKTSPSVRVSTILPPDSVPALPSVPELPLPVEHTAAPAMPKLPDAPATIPVIPTLLPDAKPVAALPPLPVAPPKFELPPAPKPVEINLDVPALPPAPPIPTPVPVKPIPAPAPPKPDVKPLPVPVFADPKPVALPAFADSPKPLPMPVEPKPAPKLAPAPAPVEAKPAALPAAVKPGEKRMKAILFLSDDRPRFEVRDGDEVYLRVVSDKVDVQSPGAGGVNVSTMRATSRVTFVTPGGEGTCEELAVLPGTGQVVVTGNVKFTYNWGRVETTVSGEKMTFRLGSNAPESTPANGTIPARFTESK
jgi:hypothetical protein